MKAKARRRCITDDGTRAGELKIYVYNIKPMGKEAKRIAKIKGLTGTKSQPTSIFFLLPPGVEKDGIQGGI